MNALPTWDDVWIGSRFFVGAWRLLRQPVSSAEAHAALRERLAARTDNFLRQARTAIYGNPHSPYRPLLERIGCEPGDLERLAGAEGLDGALQALFRQGVYLTVDEARGRQPVTRGSLSFELASGALHNPGRPAHIVNRSGGSRAGRMAVPVSFDSMRDFALQNFPDAEARGAQNWVHARWGVPGGTTLNSTLRYSLVGTPSARWFSLVDLPTSGLHPRYAWSERVLRLAARMAGVPLPRPEHVPLSHPEPIARWMAEVLRTGGTPCLHTYVSGAVRLCQAAQEAAIDLRGARFALGGEPITAGRLRVIEHIGAKVHMHYASTETGGIGRGCHAPEKPDDLHFQTDRLALLQPGDAAPPGLPPQALLFTTLAPTARLILLNVSLGDQAVVSERACGCPLARLGLTTHLHTIRSFEKLTAGGMTFFDADVLHVLDQALPVRFGGNPTDYQLLDEEVDDGQSGVRLLVHPRLGPLDEAAVREAFLAGLGGDSGTEQVMAQVWRDAGLPVVERSAPRATPGGKIHYIAHGRRAHSLATAG